MGNVISDYGMPHSQKRFSVCAFEVEYDYVCRFETWNSSSSGFHFSRDPELVARITAYSDKFTYLRKSTYYNYSFGKSGRV